MRLDKFLKVSRVIKRRTVAKDIADKGRIQVNGNPAKSGTKLKIGDELTIEFGNKTLKIRVDGLKESTRKADATSMYTILEEDFKSRDLPEFY